MNKYLVNQNGILRVFTIKGFTPPNSIGVIPFNVEEEDYPYINHRDAIDDFGTEYQEIYLDEDAKATGQIAKQATETQAKWDSLRNTRTQKLTACDYVMISDAPVSDSKRAEWAAYRQELRDLPDSIVNIDSFQWPSEPSE